MADTSTESSLSRLRWQCRRGMLELDLILNEFMDKGYDALGNRQKIVFNQILDYPDQLLFDLLLDQMKSSDREIDSLVTRIRNTIRN